MAKASWAALGGEPIWAGEKRGINVYSEGGIHAGLKARLAEPGDRLEAAFSGKVVDIIKASGELVEIQTRSLGKICDKLLSLARSQPVRLVYPVVAELSILRLDPATGELVSERKSPKRGDLYSVFDELVHAPALVSAENLSLELIFINARELRCRDGRGSWRRRGDRSLGKELVSISGRRLFQGRADWLGLLPEPVEGFWDSGSVGAALGLQKERARKILYVFAKAGLLAEAGSLGRLKRYAPLGR